MYQTFNFKAMTIQLWLKNDIILLPLVVTDATPVLLLQLSEPAHDKIYLYKYI